MTITISSRDPVLAARIRAFIDEVGVFKASNEAIAGMIWRDFQVIATPGQVSGIVGRLGISRAGPHRIDWTDDMIEKLRTMREAKLGWVSIGRALGMSEQGARDKYVAMGWPLGRAAKSPNSKPPAPKIRIPDRVSTEAPTEKAARVSAAVRTQVQGPTLAPLPAVPELAPVTSNNRTPSPWFGGQIALPRPRQAMPDWMSRPIPRAKACLWPMWKDNQHCYDVAQPFCDDPSVASGAVYCASHRAMAYSRVIKSASQAPTW